MADPTRALALLDDLCASERAGAAALAAWLARCREPALRGGLRVVLARDASHAVLAEQRLRALGGVPRAEASPSVHRLCGVVGAADVSDRAKLAVLMSRFPRGAQDPGLDALAQLDGDRETRALIETIGADDQTSLSWLRAIANEPPAPVAARPTPPAPLLAFLDALRAAEAASAEVLDAWIAVCRLDGLRGGLRTIAAREATHARLLAESLTSFGAVSRAAVPDRVRAAALECFGDAETSDESKLGVFLERYARDGAVTEPIEAAMDEVPNDVETREFLRLIAAGETGTVAWLRAYERSMSPGVVSLPGG
jgi:hypothetical protein